MKTNTEEPSRKKYEMGWEAWNYQRQLSELEALAEKRFWKLEAEDETRSRFFVKDSLGKIIFGPAHFSGLRGFFVNLPFQA